MNVDSSLRLEIISSLLGQTIKPYDKKTRGAAEDVLSVDDFHLHNLTGRRQAYSKKPLIKEEDFFDPEYDCDFTNLSDSAGCTRGDEQYERPKGWYRMALKVKGKYPDGDTWLGPKGWRSHSAPGEWPVSYHGTSLDGAKGIIKSHYSAGEGDLYGRGIYSTPDIHVAEREEYATTFTSKTTGKSYKMILQNRINPKMRKICQRFDYWLVPVRKEASAAEERKTVESSIRPYGILIKEFNNDRDSHEDHYTDGGDDGGDSGDSSSQEEGYEDSNDDYSDNIGTYDGSVIGDEDDDISDDDDGDGDGEYDDGSIDDIWEDENGDDSESDDDDGDDDDGDDDDDDDDDDEGQCDPGDADDIYGQGDVDYDDGDGYDGGKYDDDHVDGNCDDDGGDDGGDDDNDHYDDADDDEDDYSGSEDDDDWS